MSLSLGEWEAMITQWNILHGDGKPQPPTEEEFDAAILRARGIKHVQ